MPDRIRWEGVALVLGLIAGGVVCLALGEVSVGVGLISGAAGSVLPSLVLRKE